MNIEPVRRIIRGYIGYNSRLYRTGATIIDAITVWQKEGFRTYSIMKRRQAGDSLSSLPVPVTLRNLRFPILVRPGTQDVRTVINNVVREEYGQFQPRTAPKWMIDAGAYIGDTTAYFLSRFSTLKVIALEPNPLNYAIASENLKPYSESAVLLQKALSGSNQSQRFYGEFTDGAIGDTGIDVQCTTLPALLAEFHISRLDIVKLDIEGAEELVFSSDPETWLHLVDLIIIETHGPSIQALVFRILRQNGFSMKQFRGIWYCRRHQ